MDIQNIYRENQFTTTYGIKIYYQYWIPSNNHQANLIFVHGIGEHSGRYQNLVDYLLPKGFALFGLDIQGHGKSEGKKGHVHNFSTFAEQVEQLRTTMSELYNNKTLFLLGHSMGGLIALDYLMNYSTQNITGAIFTSPAFDISVKIPAWKLSLGKILSYLAPSVTMDNGINPDDLSHDKVVVELYKKDELVHDRISVGLFFTMLEVIKKATKKARNIRTPALLMLGEDDNLISKDGALRLFNILGSIDKKSCICHNSSHELFNEIDKSNNLHFMWKWIEPRINRK